MWPTASPWAPTGIWGAWLAALIYLGGLSVVYFMRFRTGRWKTIEIG